MISHAHAHSHPNHALPVEFVCCRSNTLCPPHPHNRLFFVNGKIWYNTVYRCGFLVNLPIWLGKLIEVGKMNDFVLEAATLSKGDSPLEGTEALGQIVSPLEGVHCTSKIETHTETLQKHRFEGQNFNYVTPDGRKTLKRYMLEDPPWSSDGL